MWRERYSLKDTGTALLDMVMPRLCVVCRRELILRERYICTSCLAGLPLTYHWQMPRNPMADCFNERIQRDIVSFEPYSYACALFFYHWESPYNRITQHLKYGAGLASGRYFSEMLASFLSGAGHFADADMIIPVPLHPLRRWQRGYNQAEVIARVLSERLGAEMRTDILYRARRTATQTKLSVGEKEANVASAFRVRPKALRNFTQAGGPAWPRHIILVDDVFTTGATMNECRKALRGIFPPSVRISAVSLAFVSSG